MVLFFLYFCLEENLRFFSYYSVLLNTLSESTIHMNVYKYKHLHLVVALSLPMKSEVDYPYSRLQKDLKKHIILHSLSMEKSFKKVVKLASCSLYIKLVDRSTIAFLSSTFYIYLYKISHSKF